MFSRSVLLLITSLSLCVSFFIQPKVAYAACTIPVFINEFHYDNVGADVDEFIEIAGPAGFDLAGWTLVLYNGADGKPYGSPIPLHGVFPDEMNGIGALAFAAAGIQNGSPDGMALVDDAGMVRHLVSYEGSFVATSGPATGLVLPDIGVAEGTNTPIGSSLQLTGSGECMDEFIWSGPAPASPGLLNQGQLVSSVPHVVSVEPVDGSYDVAPDAALLVTFSRAVTFDGPVLIDCTKSGVQSGAPIHLSGTSFTIPHRDFTGGETCTVTIPAGAVLGTGETPNPMTADFSWQFAIAHTPTDSATLFISHEELYSRAVVDTQDDLWRAAAQEGLICPNFLTAVLREAQNVQCGDRIGDCILPTTLSSGLVISYTLRNMDGRPLGSADAWASGHGDGCNGGSTLQDGAPRPNGIPGCYYNDAGNFRGSNSNPNAVLFTFSEPISAFGAWFGDLETKPYGTTYYRDGAGGGSGSGGAQAYLRLFFEDGAMQEATIEPTLAPGAPWLSTEAPPPALPLTAGGDVGFCGGPNAATDADGCGNSSTRWVGFVSSDPQRRVTQMLVAVGDDDHSGAGPSDGPNVVCEGGDGGTCNGGTEYLSFIGPTVCAAPDLVIAKQVEPAFVRAGDILTYTLTYSNVVSGIDTGPLMILDELPEGVQFLETVHAAPPATLLDTLSDTTPQWQVEGLPAGASGRITFTARVESGAAGLITNTARISTAGDINLANNQAMAQTFVIAPSLALSIHINGHDVSLPPGLEVAWQQPLTWTYQITNTGNVSLTHLALADDTLAPTCLEGALPATLAPGDTFTCTALRNAGLGEVSTTAVVTGTPVSGPAAPVTATTTTYYVGIASGGIEIIVATDLQLSQPFTVSTTITDPFVLVANPASGQTDRADFAALPTDQLYPFAILPVPGWNLTSIACTGAEESTLLIGEDDDFDDGDTAIAITLAPGEQVTCIFTHIGILPTLTLVKTVVNDHGGEATAADFIARIAGQPVGWQTPVSLEPGTYLVDESTLPGYTPSSWSGDCTADGHILLNMGEQKVCQITNDDTPPRLTVQHVVVNEYGGGATAGDFPLFLNGQPIESGDTVLLSAGIHTVTVTHRSDYVTTLGGDCTQNGVVTQIGDAKECLVISRDRAPVLTVERLIINDHGGSAIAADFPLFVDGVPTSEGIATPLMSGSHTVWTLAHPGYSVTFGQDCTAGGSVVLAGGERKHCIVTLDDRPASLTVQVIMVNDHGGTATPDAVELAVDGQRLAQDAPTPLHPGAYRVAASTLPGYVATFSGACDEEGEVVVANGEESVCQIFYTDITPTLTVYKVVINDNGGTAQASDFPLFVDGAPVQNGIPTVFPAGQYVVSARSQPGYAATFSGDCTADGRVTLTVGMAATCTITNDDSVTTGDILPTVEGRVWHDLNRNGLQDPFEPGVFGVWITLHTDRGEAVATTQTEANGAYAFADLAPGAYYLTFMQPDDYGFTKVAAGDASRDSDVEPLSGRSGRIILQQATPSVVVDAGLVTAPQLQFNKAASPTSLWLSPGTVQVVTYTLTYRNTGPTHATGVEIIEQPVSAVTFLASASSPRWVCVDRESSRIECRYPLGDLPAGAEGAVTFAVVIDGGGWTGNGAIQNVASLTADGISTGAATAPVILETSANVEVHTPTALDDTDEPAGFSYHFFLPWVAR